MGAGLGKSRQVIHFLLVSVETARVLLQSWWARLSTGASRQTHHDDHDDNGDEHAHADDDGDHDDDDDDDVDDDDDELMYHYIVSVHSKLAD